MDPTIAATVIGVLISVAFGAFATAFAWLRSDMNSRFDKVDARFEKVDARFERLESKVDGLIMALGSSGRLADPPLTDPPVSDADD